MRGDLTATFEKGGKIMTRTLNPDRTYKALNGEDNYIIWSFINVCS